VPTVPFRVREDSQQHVGVLRRVRVVDVEVTVGAMCACLPAVRQLIVRTCPSLVGTVRTKTDSFFRQGSGALPTVGVPGTRTTIYASKSRVSSDRAGNSRDIDVHRTYLVHFGKEDGATRPSSSEPAV
jgi:hypothetical protein